MEKKTFCSIRTKLVFMLSFSAFLALILSSFVIYEYTIEEKKQESIKSLLNLNKLMGRNLVEALKNNNSAITNRVLQTLDSHRNIDGAFIFTDNNTVLSSYIKSDRKEQKLKKIILDKYKSNDISTVIEHIDKGYIITSAPIYSEGKHLGSFSLLTSSEDLFQAIEEQLLFQAIVLCVTLFVIFILALRLQRIFTLPIFKLKDTMEEVSKTNDYSLHVQHKSNDEYQILFDGYDGMMDRIDTQDKELKFMHKQIRDSIDYASIIQKTIIPDDIKMSNNFQDCFTYWQPKDVVGGDIYLFEQLSDDESLLMVIDCTGHGVPGAFVTMLVKAIQREITLQLLNKKEEVSPAKMLNFFNKNMKELLNQDKKETISNAGFDGGIMYYNKATNLIKYASALTPLFYIQENELKIIKGCRQSVGYKKSDLSYEYKDYTLQAKKGMQFYLTTDGYIDQSGGEDGFCLGKRRFQNIIKENYQKEYVEQKEIFISELLRYQNEYDRNDDVTLIGIKI